METDNKLKNSMGNNSQDQNDEFCDAQTGICYIRTPDGLIEKKLVEKRLVVEDGRRLLTEEMPITNSRRNYRR